MCWWQQWSMVNRKEFKCKSFRLTNILLHHQQLSACRAENYLYIVRTIQSIRTGQCKYWQEKINWLFCNKVQRKERILYVKRSGKVSFLRKKFGNQFYWFRDDEGERSCALSNTNLLQVGQYCGMSLFVFQFNCRKKFAIHCEFMRIKIELIWLVFCGNYKGTM